MPLSVVVPAYNEGDRIVENLLEIAGTLASFATSWEIVVVDDGSCDATGSAAARAQRLIPELRVLSYPRNRGKGFALRHGAAHARGDVVAFLDADLELHPNQLPVLLGILNRRGADCVVGSKRHRDAVRPSPAQGFPMSRRILSGFYGVLVRWMFRLPVRDTQAGIKVFRGEVLSDVLPAVRTDRFAFDLDLLVQAQRAGYRVAEAPVAARFLRRSSRLTLRDILCIWTDTMRLYWRVHMAPRPLRAKRAIPVER